MHESRRTLASIILLIILIYLLVVWGVKLLFNLNWIDSFYYASLIMAGVSLEVKPETNSQKIFIAITTLVMVGLYLILIAVIIAYFLKL